MSVSYNVFESAFLSKITEYEMIKWDDQVRTEIVDGYLKGAVSEFNKICKYDLIGNDDVENRVYDIDVTDEDMDEIVGIISEGMVVQWMKQYLYRQELLENAMNTRDFTTYSPAELLMRVGNAYKQVKYDYTQMIREYSYNHGDLTSFHI